MSVKVTTKHLYMGFGQVNGLSGLFYQTLSKTKCVWDTWYTLSLWKHKLPI